MPSLSIVVVTYNSRDAVTASLPSVRAALGEGDELVVVDNDSSDGTVAAVRELASRGGRLRTGRNAGFAAGANAGAARGER